MLAKIQNITPKFIQNQIFISHNTFNITCPIPYTSGFPMNSAQPLGYLRDRTSQYKTYRTSTQKARGSYKSALEEELNPIGFDPEPATDNTLIETANSVEARFDMIEMDIQALADMHKRRKRVDFGNDKKLDAEIEAKTRNISTQITQLRDLIKPDNSPGVSAQKRMIQKNMQYGFSARLKDVTIRFRDMQAGYINTIRKQKDRAAMIAQDDDEVDDLDDIDVAFTDSQMQQVRANDLMLRQRNEEITSLISMMNQLNDLFADLGTLLVEQGTMLDRIDGKIEEAIEDVETGNEHLEKADEHQSSKCFYWYIGIVLLLIIVFGVIIIVRKGNVKKEGK